MPVKRCVLRNIHTLAEFYDDLARQLVFPPHFGRNLDALWDVLTGEVGGPFEIIWKDTDFAQEGLGADFDRLIALLDEVAAEREDFTFIRQ
ncbi:MAG: barstar family protein [Betaproteobacteria bacterium]|nr:barstar family protein [Betaproteobacteria bacterium]